MIEGHYCYIFVRQDLSTEQQIVQAAHAASVMSCTPSLREIDFSKTNFIVIGVRNQDALWAVESILDKFEIKYDLFYEPDIDEDTAIATYPLDPDSFERDVLSAFNLLKHG